MTLIYLNLIVSGAAATVYGVITYKWYKRRSIMLMVLNSIAAFACFGFSLGYIWLVVGSTHAGSSIDVSATRDFVRSFTPLVLLAPAVARFIELRREEQREAFAEEFYKELSKNGA